MKGLNLGGITLPVDAATQTFGILAKRRVGKTYTASVMAEEFAACGVPFTVLDPTGAWWGLRSSADGRKAGLPVVILGGEHGDVPLERHGGKVAADLVVDHPGYYVLDLVGFESGAAQDTFAADFLDRLYRRKAQATSPMHLFIDEADGFAPQRPGPGQLKMLGAVEAIVRRGGIRGIGTTLITQRAAVINKNVLTQLDCLIALQVTGPQDQKAIRDWVNQDGTPEQVREMMDSLAGLGRGQAWVWSPGWLERFERITVRERRTFNSSATPEVGVEAITPAKLAAVDLEAVRTAMAATIEKQRQDDPKVLRARIAELEREARAVPEPIVQTVEVPVLTLEDRDAWQAMVTEARDLARQMDEAARSIDGAVQSAYLRGVTVSTTNAPAGGGGGPNGTKRAPETTVEARFPMERRTPYLQPAVETASRRVAADLVDAAMRGVGEEPLKAGARKMLDTLARQHPFVLTRAQLGTLAGMKHTGGTFGTYLSAMRTRGYIRLEGKQVLITEAGLQAAGVEPGNPMTAEEVREEWRGRLKAGAREMFDVLAQSYPNGLTRGALAEHVGMAPTGGTFGTYLSTLRSNGLITTEDGMVTMTDTGMGVNA